MFVGQLFPHAEREHLAVGARERSQRAEGRAHLPLVVQALVHVDGEVSRVLAGQPLERGSVPALRASQVPKHVRRDPEQPRDRLVAFEHDLPSASPGLEEHDRGQLFGLRPVAGAPEAVVVDGPGVPLEDRSEGLGVALGGAPPESGVCQLTHHLSRVRSAGRVPV